MSEGELVPTAGQKGNCQMCGKGDISFKVMAGRAFFLCSRDCENRYSHLRAQALQLGQVSHSIDTTGMGMGDYMRAERQRVFDSNSYCWHCGAGKKVGEDNCRACGAQADVPIQ